MTLRVSEICKCGVFFSELEDKQKIRENVTSYLLQLKLPARIKAPSGDKKGEEIPDKKRGRCSFGKPNIMEGAVRSANEDSSGFFGVPLEKLVTLKVTLRTGQILLVPRCLHEMCVFVLAHAEVKGIFRKPGSGVKQESIKNHIESHGKLPSTDLDVQDVAVVIKYFLRKLPTPLIPEPYQELFLSCVEHADRQDVLVLACLLLPVPHLNLLTYLMQFFDQVASHHNKNQMNAYNIAVCTGPNIMPVYRQQLVKQVVTVVQILIEKSDLVGTVPEAMRKMPPVRKRTICHKIIEKIWGKC